MWALGTLGDIVRRTASGWQRVQTPFSLDTDHSYAVHPISDDDVWIGGTYQSAHWDGQGFTLVPELTDVRAFWSASSTNIWAVGESGMLAHYDGTACTTIASPSGPKNLYAIDGTSANDVWAVGASAVLHYDGTAWSTIDAGISAYESVSTVVAIAADDVWIAGEAQQLRHFNGTSWTTVTATSVARPWIRSAWASGPDDVWFVLAGSELLHWNGSTLEHEPLPRASTLVHAGGMQWAFGEDGTIRRR